MMLVERWTYSNRRGLTKWYGHVDYYGRYVIGQWFALDADTGREYWVRRFVRPNTIRGFARGVIVASEMRSDGPWTTDFGIYGIDARTGRLLWVNHARGFWGTLLRCLDYIPGFTNELRDAPKWVDGQHIMTASGRILDVRTGRECRFGDIAVRTSYGQQESEHPLYGNRSVCIAGNTIRVEKPHDDLVITCWRRSGRAAWRFSTKALSLYGYDDYYSCRFLDHLILLILGDAPKYVPIGKAEPRCLRANRANYQLGILDVSSGDFRLFPLIGAKKQRECRMEAVRGSRILISCGGTQLTEYEITT